MQGRQTVMTKNGLCICDVSQAACHLKGIELCRRCQPQRARDHYPSGGLPACVLAMPGGLSLLGPCNCGALTPPAPGPMRIGCMTFEALSALSSCNPSNAKHILSLSHVACCCLIVLAMQLHPEFSSLEQAEQMQAQIGADGEIAILRQEPGDLYMGQLILYWHGQMVELESGNASIWEQRCIFNALITRILTPDMPEPAAAKPCTIMKRASA